MDFARHLQLRTPIVWVHTTDPIHITNQIIRYVSNDIFRVDAVDGLQTYEGGRWHKVLVDGPDEENLFGPLIQRPTNNIAVSLHHVAQQSGTCLVLNAHQMAEKYANVFASVAERYVDSLYRGLTDEFPMQFILVSPKDEVPVELSGITTVLDSPTPSVTDLAEITANIARSAEGNGRKVLPEKVDLSSVTKAGLGMSESEYVSTVLLSIAENGVIDPKFVLEKKLERIKRGGLLEILKPEKGLEDIGGMDIAKNIIRQAAEAWGDPVATEEFGIRPMRKFLLVGVPGSGKSAICQAAAKSIGTDLARFGVSKAMNMFVGESERRMRQAFAEIDALRPITVWIDEFGRDAAEGDYMGDSGTTTRVHGEMLTGIQELADDVLLICAANRIDRLPPETLRAGRFDATMFVGFPTLEERVEIFRVHLGERAKGHDLEELAAATATYTGAEIEALIDHTRFKVYGPERRHIKNEDLLTYAPDMRNRIWLKHPGEVYQSYIRALDEWDWASTQQQAEAELVIEALEGNNPTKTQGKSFATSW